MLVLSRNRDESVVIRTPEGREIVVAVVDIRGDKVRLGFQADTDISVHRWEIQRVIDEEGRREKESA